MGNDEELRILIEARNNAKKAFDEADAQLKAMGTSFTDTTSKMQSFRDKASEIGGNLQAFGAKMTLGVTIPITLLGKKMFNAAADFEQTQVAFETMLGSAEKAKSLLQDLDDLAVKTPFEITEIQQAGRQMLAYGIEADKVVDTTRMLGDVSAGLGRGTFPQLTLAYGQVKAKGKLMGQELLQLTNAGFNVAEAMGVSREELLKMMQTGAGVTFEQVEKAFIRVTSEGGRFHNMMQRQSKTTAGQLSNMKDEFTRLLRDVGEQLLPFGKTIAQGLKKAVEWFSKLSDKTKTFILAALGVISVIGPLTTFIGTLVTAIGFLVSPIGLTVVAIVGLVAAFVIAYKKSEKFREIVSKAAKMIKEQWDKLVKVFKEDFLPALKDLWKTIQPLVKVIGAIFGAAFIASILQTIFVLKSLMLVFSKVVVPVIKAIAWYVENVLFPVWKTVWEVVKEVWDKVSAYISFVWNTVLKPIWDLIWSYITNVLVPTWQKIFDIAKKVFDGVWSAIQTAWGFIKPIWDLIWAYITNVLVPIFQKIWDTVKDVFEKVKTGIGVAIDWIKEKFDKAKEFVQGLINAFINVKDKIMGAFTGAKDWLFDIGKDIIDGLVNGAKSILKKLGELFLKVVPDWIKEPFKKALGIKSPSTVFKEYGVYTIEGLAEGLQQQKMLSKAMAGVSGAVSGGYSPSVAVAPSGLSRSSNSAPVGFSSGTHTFNMYGNINISTPEAADRFFERLDNMAELSEQGVAL